MLLGRVGRRALLGVGIAVGVCGGGVGGLAVTDASAATVAIPQASSPGLIVPVQSGPSSPGGTTAPAAPGKEPQAQPKPKPKEKQRRLTPCGPGLAPCGDTKQ